MNVHLMEVISSHPKWNSYWQSELRYCHLSYNVLNRVC